MHLATAVINPALTSALAVTQWVGLSTTLPADDASSGVTEPVGGGYARVQLLGTSWTVAANRMIESAVDVNFPTPTADWGVAVAYVLFTASTAGVARGAGRLADGPPILTGATVSLAAGSIHAEAP